MASSAITEPLGQAELFMSQSESSPGRAKPVKAVRRETAESMALKQKDISVSEFFAKNRHLLGFDNPRKALLTTVKEAVDNSLDACEEAGILPEVWVHIEAAGPNRFNTARNEGHRARLSSSSTVRTAASAPKGTASWYWSSPRRP